MVKYGLPKARLRVRFPSSAPLSKALGRVPRAFDLFKDMEVYSYAALYFQAICCNGGMF